MEYSINRKWNFACPTPPPRFNLGKTKKKSEETELHKAKWLQLEIYIKYIFINT